SGDVHASTRTRDNDTIGAMIPTRNSVNANTPTATTLCSPDAAPAATPYAPSVNSTIEVSVSSPGPFTRSRERRGDGADDLADDEPAGPNVDTVGQRDPVGERRGRDRLHVVGRHEVTAHDRGVRLRGA